MPSSPTFSVSNNLLAQLRKTAVTYTELLEHSAATARNENLRDLLEDHADLQHAKSACFSPAFHACTSTRDTTELPPPLAAPAAAPEQPQPTRTTTASPKDPLICDDPQRNTFQGNEVIFGGHIECDAAPSSGLNPYSRKAAACASSVAAPAAPPPSMERPKKTYYCQICDKEMPQFNERCHSCKRSGCTDCITYPGPTHVKPSCVLCDKDDGASQESAWEELLFARTCRRIYNERKSQRIRLLAELQQDMNFPPCPSHNIPPSTESYASPTTRGSFSPCSSCFTPPNAFYTFPQTWCSEEDPTTPSSTLPSPPRHASCQHIQNESRVLFNQWWTQTSDMTFLERVEAKRTRDFPQDFVDPATTPEPSPKKPRTLEPTRAVALREQPANRHTPHPRRNHHPSHP